MGAVDHFESAAGAGDAVARAWREPPALTLDENGVIVDCSGHGAEFFGYTRSELSCQHVSMVLPGLFGLELFEDGQPNAYFHFLCHIGHTFEVMPRAGVAFLCAFSLVCLTGAGRSLVRLIVQSPPKAGA
jgi:hypothetical protein